MLKPLFHSFAHALHGIRIALKTERSFRLQVAAALCVVLSILILPVTPVESAVLLLAVGAILVLELLNSMIERMMDLFKPRLHPYVRDIKDLTAAAVLLASVFALAVGIVVLGPHASLLIRL